MWGSDIGYLTIQKRYDYTQSGLHTVANSLSGDHGSDWNLATFILDNVNDENKNKNFKVSTLSQIVCIVYLDENKSE